MSEPNLDAPASTQPPPRTGAAAAPARPARPVAYTDPRRRSVLLASVLAVGSSPDATVTARAATLAGVLGHPATTRLPWPTGT